MADQKEHPVQRVPRKVGTDLPIEIYELILRVQLQFESQLSVFKHHFQNVIQNEGAHHSHVTPCGFNFVQSREQTTVQAVRLKTDLYF